MKTIIIGSGPAGLMAADKLNDCGVDTLIIEQNEKIGKKLYITGKGRCNVTNNCDKETFFANVVTNPRFLYSAFNSFDNFSTISFFEDNGIKLKTERGERVFPESDKSSDIIKGLSKHCGKVLLNTKVTDFIIEDNTIKGVKTNNGEYFADSVIVATGGISYSSTGSTGDGYKYASKIGHDIIEPVPSLVGVRCKDKWICELTGLSLKNVKATFVNNGKEVISEFGEMLFTNDGVSGPIILTISAYINRLKFDNAYIDIDLKPALDDRQLDDRLLRDFEENTNRDFKNSLNKLLPSSLIPVFVKLSQIPENKKINTITMRERKSIIELLKHFRVRVETLNDINTAIVTSGGISTKQINPSTMESKLIKRLFFAGEIIDVDALTGGFNIQIALSTGYLAGQSAYKLYGD